MIKKGLFILLILLIGCTPVEMKPSQVCYKDDECIPFYSYCECDYICASKTVSTDCTGSCPMNPSLTKPECECVNNKCEIK